MTRNSTADKTESENTEEKTAIPEKESATPPLQRSLFDKELDRFRQHMQRGFDTAYKYYGFTLFHSLSRDEKVELFQKLGFKPKNPEDFYNLGCLAFQKEDYPSARKHFEKTIELAADFEEAYHNLALTLEKMDDISGAIENWDFYIQFLDEDSTAALLISQHIEELKQEKNA